MLFQEDSLHTAGTLRPLLLLPPDIPGTQVSPSRARSSESIPMCRRYYPKEVLYWQGVSRENRRLLSKILRIDRVSCPSYHNIQSSVMLPREDGAGQWCCL